MFVGLFIQRFPLQNLCVASLSALLTMALQRGDWEALGQSRLLDSMMQAVEAKLRACDAEEAQLLAKEMEFRDKYLATEKQIEKLEAKAQKLTKTHKGKV